MAAALWSSAVTRASGDKTVGCGPLCKRRGNGDAPRLTNPRNYLRLLFVLHRNYLRPRFVLRTRPPSAGAAGSATLLLIPLGDNGSRVGIDDVMWPTAFQPGILQFVIDVPAVVFQHKLNPVQGQVPVHSCCICLGNGQYLVASKAHHTVSHSLLSSEGGYLVRAGNQDHRSARPGAKRVPLYECRHRRG